MDFGNSPCTAEKFSNSMWKGRPDRNAFTPFLTRTCKRSSMDCLVAVCMGPLFRAITRNLTWENFYTLEGHNGARAAWAGAVCRCLSVVVCFAAEASHSASFVPESMIWIFSSLILIMHYGRRMELTCLFRNSVRNSRERDRNWANMKGILKEVAPRRIRFFKTCVTRRGALWVK